MQDRHVRNNPFVKFRILCNHFKGFLRRVVGVKIHKPMSFTRAELIQCCEAANVCGINLLMADFIFSAKALLSLQHTHFVYWLWGHISLVAILMESNGRTTVWQVAKVVAPLHCAIAL